MVHHMALNDKSIIDDMSFGAERVNVVPFFHQVEAINQKRTLAFINHWVLHTVAFLNQFSAMCEERLIALDTKLRRADHSLAILEAKVRQQSVCVCVCVCVCVYLCVTRNHSTV